MFSIMQCVKTLSSEPMTVYFTSGTTGLPKMAEHTHTSCGLGHIITGKYDFVESSLRVQLLPSPSLTAHVYLILYFFNRINENSSFAWETVSWVLGMLETAR